MKSPFVSSLSTFADIEIKFVASETSTDVKEDSETGNQLRCDAAIFRNASNVVGSDSPLMQIAESLIEGSYVGSPGTSIVNLQQIANELSLNRDAEDGTCCQVWVVLTDRQMAYAPAFASECTKSRFSDLGGNSIRPSNNDQRISWRYQAKRRFQTCGGWKDSFGDF